MSTHTNPKRRVYTVTVQAWTPGRTHLLQLKHRCSAATWADAADAAVAAVRDAWRTLADADTIAAVQP